MTLTRRMMLSGLTATAATAACGRAPETSRLPSARPADFARRNLSAATELIANAGISGNTSFLVADARTGEMLEANDPDAPLPPASTSKALTALYALGHMGQSFRYETQLLATGDIRDGRLNGDLILAGRGDPTLNTDALATMAAELKARGVRQVSGRFLTYSGEIPYLFEIDPNQPDTVGYNPAVDGLNLNFNRVHFEWRRQGADYSVQMDGRSGTHRPPVSFAKMQILDRASPTYTYRRGDGVDQWTVARRALGSGGTRWLPVRVPSIYAAQVFSVLARAQGIKLTPGGATTQPRGSVLVRHFSDPLPGILRDMLHFSNNLTAEVVGLSTSAAQGRRVTGLAQSAGMMSRWVGNQARGARFNLVDHSGLGDQSRVTAQGMVDTLLAQGPNSQLRAMMKPFPVSGRSDINVASKTGTLNFVSCLTGYVAVPGGRDLVFAIQSADMPRRQALSTAERERPSGGVSWTQRARALQGKLLSRWATYYGA